MPNWHETESMLVELWESENAEAARTLLDESLEHLRPIPGRRKNNNIGPTVSNDRAKIRDTAAFRSSGSWQRSRLVRVGGRIRWLRPKSLLSNDADEFKP
jgi:hypothetical protein